MTLREEAAGRKRWGAHREQLPELVPVGLPVFAGAGACTPGIGALSFGTTATVSIPQLRVSGGGSQSDGAMQVTADISGPPATRPQLFETSVLGAAIAAVAAMTCPGRSFEPVAAHHALQDELYREVYPCMDSRTTPL